MSAYTEAADLLRTLADGATPGTWADSSTGNGVRFSALVSDHRHPDRRPGGGWDWEDAYGGCLIGESLMSGDRAFIAAMNPDVAKLLAGLLEAIRAEDPATVGQAARGLAEELTLGSRRGGKEVDHA